MGDTTGAQDTVFTDPYAPVKLTLGRPGSRYSWDGESDTVLEFEPEPGNTLHSLPRESKAAGVDKIGLDHPTKQD